MNAYAPLPAILIFAFSPLNSTALLVDLARIESATRGAMHLTVEPDAKMSTTAPLPQTGETALVGLTLDSMVNPHIPPSRFFFFGKFFVFVQFHIITGTLWR